MLVRGEAVTAGYWEDPQATSQAFHEGWFKTGDLGRRDRDGYYWFVGRCKEIIVRGGSNISPLEVEEALARHHSVQEVAVVGVPHPSLGETVAAFVVLRPGADATLYDLRRFASELIAAYKVPELIEFLEEMPRGLTGKIHRKTLKDRAAQHSTLIS
jgi:long-chain acyl-CoA synthetase